ncbi:MAG: signal peptidase I [Candidatus Omnitrophica bacterium]|nr:signal peptidase I [Candidatus Omnitrophota bacterium]MCK5590708.1 signal peptidase I [Candidatus Paceibacterota bacterium]
MILLGYLAHPLTRLNWFFGYVGLGIFAILFLYGIQVLIDSYKCANSFNRHHNIKINASKSRRICLILGIFFLVFVFNPSSIVKSTLVQAFKIPAGAMKPTLVEGDRVLVNKAIYRFSEPKRGDVIVFGYPERPKLAFIKRLVGLPGEKVEIKQGKIIINGTTIKNLKHFGGYFNAGSYGQEGQVIEIPPGNYFVLGDNTLNSRDSRYWGFLPKENLIGKAYKIYFPFNRAGPIK